MDSNQFPKRLAVIRVLVEPKPEHRPTQDYTRNVLPTPRLLQRVPAARVLPKASMGGVYRHDASIRCDGLEPVWQSRR